VVRCHGPTTYRWTLVTTVTSYDRSDDPTEQSGSDRPSVPSDTATLAGLIPSFGTTTSLIAVFLPLMPADATLTIDTFLCVIVDDVYLIPPV